MPSARNKADVEYAVMLAVLNFKREFMQSRYSLIQVRLRESLLEVDLTRTSPIPAEQRLAQTQEGRAQLRQMHQALFAVGQERLQKGVTEILGGQIYEICTDLDPLTGKSTWSSGEEAIGRPGSSRPNWRRNTAHLCGKSKIVTEENKLMEVHIDAESGAVIGVEEEKAEKATKGESRSSPKSIRER